MDSKVDWKTKILVLHSKGLGPLSISVRLSLPWKTVVQFLEEQKRVPVELYDLNAKTYHSNEN